MVNLTNDKTVSIEQNIIIEVERYKANEKIFTNKELIYLIWKDFLKSNNLKMNNNCKIWKTHEQVNHINKYWLLHFWKDCQSHS